MTRTGRSGPPQKAAPTKAKTKAAEGALLRRDDGGRLPEISQELKAAPPAAYAEEVSSKLICVLADRGGMRGVVDDSRTAVMILVEASWEDQSGTLRTVPARMENKSAGGACIRVKARIGVGSEVRVQWRWEKFSGIAKYCRSEGREYLVGLQRVAMKSELPTISNRPVSTDVALRENVRGSEAAVQEGKPQDLPKREESKASEIVVAKPKVESAPIVRTANSDRDAPGRGWQPNRRQGETPRTAAARFRRSSR
jgi:hypothetical protein